jgi:serine/threonine protein phosphatase PrpC
VKLEAVMVTDVGVVRDHNEDSAHVDPLRRFFIVADGMGGHAAGEVASAMAVETVQHTLEGATSLIDAFVTRPTENARRALVQLLQSAVLAAHQAVYQRGNKESDKAGMGTTLDVLLIAGQEAFVAHVGDSRTYLIRDGKAAQLTTDHTVAEVLVIEGKLTIEEALVSPYRTVLVNAIGVAADVGVEMAHLQLKKGDRLLLCSDGLHDYFLAEQEIADTLTNTAPEDKDALGSLGSMVETAKDRGGHDNITGVVITVVDLGEAVPAVVEHDQTLPVEVPLNPSTAWNDDERTENISPKDLDRLSTGAPSMPDGASSSGDDGTRPTAPMDAVTGTESTDPGINIAAIDKALADAKVSADGPTEPVDARAVRQALARLTAETDTTEPAIDANVVKAALSRATAVTTRPSPVGGDDPTVPGLDVSAIRAQLARAGTEPPPEDDATVDRRAAKGRPSAAKEAKEPKEAPPAAGAAKDAKDTKDGKDGKDKSSRPDSLGTEDTGPSPRIDANKLG